MVTFLTVLHVLVCVFLIIVVLLQAGKGGGMGLAFGGAGSQTVFGSSGAGNFLTRLTSVTAFVFLITSLGLAHYSSQQDSKRLQLLAERKASEKKVEDEKAAKLKAELDKAREAAKKMPAGDVPAPNSSELPLPPPKPGEAGKPGELKLTPPGAKTNTAPNTTAPAKGLKLEGEGATKPAGAAKPAATTKPAEGQPAPAKPAPKKVKRQAAPPAEGEAPAAAPPPAEAPAAPAQ
jgi:preprotein translocase subunit SecG